MQKLWKKASRKRRDLKEASRNAACETCYNSEYNDKAIKRMRSESKTGEKV